MDVAAVAAACGNPAPEEVTLGAFRLAAQLHAEFWRAGELLDRGWLRSADWHQGRGQDRWEAAQAMAREAWVPARIYSRELCSRKL